MDGRRTRPARGPASQLGRSRPATLRALVALVCAGTALAAGGCSTPVNPGTPTSSAPYVSTTPVPPAEVVASLTSGELTLDLVTDPPPFPEVLEPAVAAPSLGAVLTVTDVRVARHEGFDRVVYELAGSGLPGWTVGYVSQAVQDGSGMIIELEGRSTLWVSISGSGYPSQTGAVPFSHPTTVRGDQTTAVTEVQGWSAFEGTTGSFIGVSGRDLPYRVFLLDDPVRVVVDVEHPQP